MTLFACLTTLAIALVSYEVGIHLSEEAEGIIVLAMIACLIFGMASLILLPWFLKLAILLLLLVSKWYLPSSVVKL